MHSPRDSETVVSIPFGRSLAYDGFFPLSFHTLAIEYSNDSPRLPLLSSVKERPS